MVWGVTIFFLFLLWSFVCLFSAGVVYQYDRIYDFRSGAVTVSQMAKYFDLTG